MTGFEPPRGSIVQVPDGSLYVVMGRLPRPFSTELVCREWIVAPHAEPDVIRIDHRDVIVVATPQQGVTS